MLPPFKVALGVRGGTHSGLGMSKTSGLGFAIAAGRAVVEPSNPSSGPYVVTVDATETLSFSPGDATRARIDLVCIKVNETAGVENPGDIVIIQGSYPSAGGPVRPSIPAAHEALYQVTIPAGMSAGNGGWSTANRTDLRRPLVTLGSPIPVNSASERNALATYEGMQVMRLDLNGSVDRFTNGRWRGNTEWIRVPLDAGWTPVASHTYLKVKLTADGNLGMVYGELKYTGTNPPQEGWIMGRIPASAMDAGITPEENSWVLGTDDSYHGTVVITVTAGGHIRVGPFPTGRIFMFQGTFPVNMQ